MTHEFDQELDRLRIDSLRMFYMVREAVDKAVRATRLRDSALSQEVMDGDEAVDAMECLTEHLGLRLLALKQPVARDLRTIMGSMRIASNLERIGDEAVNIVGRNLLMLESGEFQDVPSVWSLGEMCLELFDKSARAFADSSYDQAQAVLDAHEQTAIQHMKSFRDLTEIMIREARTVDRAVQLSFVAYSLKRICERSFNIAESVIFIVKGLDVKHKGCRIAG